MLSREPSYSSRTTSTFSHSSGFVLSVLTVGYDIPERFQTTGFSEGANVKLAIISDRTTSRFKVSCEHGWMSWACEFLLTHLQLGECETAASEFNKCALSRGQMDIGGLHA